MEQDAPLNSRLGALEESQLYAERLVEQLAEQMKALNNAHDSLARRLGALEARLGEVDRRVDTLGAEPDAPPADDPA